MLGETWAALTLSALAVDGGAMSEPSPEGRALPLVWVGIEDLPIVFANQMLKQHVGRTEFDLAFGPVTPPGVLGDDELKARQLEEIAFVGVRPIARVSLNRQRLQELIRVLQENLATHDQTFGTGDEQ
jgi:hypothetical protein